MDNNLGGINNLEPSKSRATDGREELTNDLLSGLANTLGKPVDPQHQLIRDDFHAFGRLVMGRKDMPFHAKIRQMLMDESNAVFLLPRGYAKCLHGDTLVYLSNGNLIQIKDIRVGDEVVGVNNHMRLQNGEVSSVSVVDDSQAFEIIDSAGNRLILSGNHRLLTINGWVELSNLKVGSWIATPRKVPSISGESNVSDNELKLLGYWISEGTCKRGQYQVTTNDKSQQDELVLISSEYGWNCNIRDDISITFNGGDNGNKSWDLIRRFDLQNCTSSTKFIPMQVMQSSDRQVSLFLSRLYSGDGWAEYRHLPNNKTRRCVSYSTISKILAIQVKILLLRFDIQSNIYYNKQMINGEEYISYSVVCNNIPSILLFNKHIGFYGNKSKILSELIDNINNTQWNNYCHYDLIPSEWRIYNSTLEFRLRKSGVRVDTHKYNITRDKLIKVSNLSQNSKLIDIATSDIKWEKIKSIKQIDNCKMYDITVSGIASFIANGIISHNSSIVSVEYPLWLLGKNRDLRIIIATNALRLGIEWLREIENVMANNQLYREVYGNLIPEARTGTWTDVEKIVTGRSPKATHTSLYVVSTTGSTLGKRADIIICVPGYTKIETEHGSKRIRDIKIGDLVRTHTGSLKRVTQVFERQWYGKMVELETKYHKLTLTDNHPVLNNNKWTKPTDIKRLSHLHRISSVPSSVKQCLSFKLKRENGYRRNKVRHIHLDAKFSYLLGLYAAEGSSSANRIGFTFGSHEVDLISIAKSIINEYLGDITIDSHNSWSTTLFFNSSIVKDQFREWFGNNASTKRVPEFMFNSSDINKANFLLGYLDGDATHSTSGKHFGSASIKLRDGIMQLCNALYIACSTHNSDNFYAGYIDSNDYRKLLTIAHNAYIVSNIRNTRNHTGKVYNLEVEDDNSYIANGFIVHNCDDIFEPEKGIPTENQIRGVKEWFWKVLYPVLEPGTGKIFVVGTRFHSMDLYGELIDNDWPHILQAAIETDQNGKEISTWPERFSIEELQKRRNSMGSIMFNLQYQNNADISSRLQLEFLHFLEADEIPKDLVIYQGVDPCLAVGANSDYFAVATIGVSEKTGKGYLLDLVRARVGFHQQLEIIMQQAVQWNPRKIGIETNAAQVFMKEALQDAEESPSPTVRRLSKRKFHLPIFPLISRASKQSRIMEMSAMFESGLISIKAVKDGAGLVPTTNLEPFVSEWLMFPQGKHDDALDAVGHATRVAEFGLPPPISTYKEADLPYYRRRQRLTMFHK